LAKTKPTLSTAEGVAGGYAGAGSPCSVDLVFVRRLR
jgi:hypothetical protein